MKDHLHPPGVLRTLGRRRLAVVAIASLAATTVGATAATATSEPVAEPEVVYNTIPVDPPASYPSLGYNAVSTNAFGDIVELDGTNRMLESVTVSMNSWACETGNWTAECVTTPGSSFTHPITVSIYAVEGEGAAAVPGALLGEVTQDVTVPYRPSADEANCGVDTTQWYDEAGDSCQNGYSFHPEFDMSSLELVLPDTIGVTVSLLTSKNSELPIGGGYDSLNIDVGNVTPTVGTDVDPAAVLWNAYGSYGDGTLIVDSDWAEYVPVLEITAVPVPALDAYLEDFEGDGDPGLSLASRVASTSDMLAAAGCYYGAAPITNYSLHATEGFVFTKYAGYSSKFPTAGYTASADFYLAGDAAEGQFSWSHAVNGSDGNHQRDFAFHAGSDGAGSWSVGVSNGVSNTEPYVTGFSVEPLVVTEAGWYTFQHTFYAEGGLLWADLSVLDAAGATLASWTLGGNAADEVHGAVGGNRYGWLVNNPFEGLPVDNVLINSERPTDVCPPADFTALNEAVAAAGDAVEAHYTADSYSALTVAVAGADDVRDALTTEQDIVDAATAAIIEAKNALELLPADVEQLQLALIAAGEPNRDDRTPESLALLDAAIVLGTGALDSTILEQDEVDAAVAVINAAILALDYLPANIDALEAAFAAAKAVNRTGRTDASLAALDAAVEHGKSLLDANITKQADVATAAAEILEAIDALKYRAADTSELVAQLERLDRLDLSRYTRPSVAKVTLALEGAEALLDADVRDQADVDAKARQLKKAINALVKIPTFTDIADSPFKKHIEWFAAEGITTGYSDGTYRPLGSVNRDAMAAFLYRWAGSPSFTPPAKSPFSDIPTTHQFYKEISWLAAEGISTGWKVDGAREFRPSEPINRDAMAAFLYRISDVEGFKAPERSPFLDMEVGDPFFTEIAWLAEQGVTTGWSVEGGSEFRPQLSISREAMAAFLSRMARG